MQARADKPDRAQERAKVEASPMAVYGAIAANIGIAVTKFVVGSVTGSSAMLSEGIHSAVDTVNGMLLLGGLKQSRRPATGAHPFGHGKDLYFWSLIVAVLIFGLGGGMSFFEGVRHISHPAPLTDPTWNYVVLGAAAVFESGSLALALREFMDGKQRGSFWRAVRRSKDPTVYTVMAEDSAALLGLLIAGAGVFLSHRLQMPELDGAASVLIGLLLAAVAVLLVRHARGLLIGEGVAAETVQAISEMALKQPRVRLVGRVLSMYLGPHEVLATMELGFQEGTLAAEAAEAVEALKAQVRLRFPMITQIFVEVA